MVANVSKAAKKAKYEWLTIIAWKMAPIALTIVIRQFPMARNIPSMQETTAPIFT
jgi:hypothetical protein